MFDDLRYLINSSKLPDTTKVPLTIAVKAVAWLPWLFVGISLLLTREYFVYWFAIFAFLEGFMLLTLVYLLVAVLRQGQPADPASGSEASQATNTLGGAVLKGVLGNAAFYLFILIAFVLVKAMGTFDGLWRTLMGRLAQ